MKILMLSWNFPPVIGGMEYVAENLFDGLRAKGHDVRLLTSGAEGVPAREGVQRAPHPGLKNFVWFSIARGWSLARIWRPDFILCGSVVSLPAAWLLRRLLGIPFAMLIHGTDVLTFTGWKRALLRHGLTAARFLCANSENTARILESTGLAVRPIEVLYPGVLARRYLSAPAQGVEDVLPLLEGRRVLLFVGRLVRRKGVLEFVQHVLPQLGRRHPELCLLIAGDDPGQSLVHRERMRDRILEVAEVLGLQDNVILRGGLKDDSIARLYFAAELFVMPCIDVPGDVEGFGIVFLEAALAGIPAVATRIGGIPEAVVDGETGLLVPSGDWEAMEAAIEELLANPARRQKLGAAARARALREFDWPVIVDKYLAAIARHMDGKASA